MLDSEIVKGFQDETSQIVAELNSVVEGLEDAEGEFPAKLLEEFAQKIDRIMGTAKTLSVEAPSHQGLRLIGKLGEICKATGYKAAQGRVTLLLPVFAAFWADTIEVIDETVANLNDESKVNQLTQKFSPVLQKRLEWLARKVLEHAKTVPGGAQSEIQVDALLAQFKA